MTPENPSDSRRLPEIFLSWASPLSTTNTHMNYLPPPTASPWTAKWNGYSILCALTRDKFKDKGWKTLWERKHNMRVLRHQPDERQWSSMLTWRNDQQYRSLHRVKLLIHRPLQLLYCYSLGQEIPGPMNCRLTFPSKAHKEAKIRECDHKQE